MSSKQISGKQMAIKALGLAYEQMAKETSGRPCLSRRARERAMTALEDAIVSCSERDQVARLCLLVRARMEEPERFRLPDDLGLMDATQDIVNCGRPQDWKITPDLKLRFL
jgi:hypothetical protein